MGKTENRNPNFMTAYEVAELFGCTPRHVYKMCERGQLKHVRLGKTVRINRAAVYETAGLTDPARLG